MGKGIRKYMADEKRNADSICCGENERVDDLQCKGRMLIQNKEVFCFGMDAVLLANYAVVNAKEKCMDLCTGNGIIPILLEAKTNGSHFTGLEIQDISAQLARRNVELNGVGDKIDIVQEDVKNVSSIYKDGTFDVVTVNPPYMNENHGIVNPSAPKAIARHEILCSLEDIIRGASAILKEKGRFYMVHRPQRLVEIFELCRRYRLEPKRMKLVYPYAGKNANMVLIEAVRGGNSQLTAEPALVVYNDDGTYTKELLERYKS
ncbi:MAG: tRNA1(Val) (adenine(37)-N6)-methyltransferase [Bacteroides sp.]